MTTENRLPLTAERVQAALTATGSVTKAAAELGYSRQTVHEWMKKHDIKRRVEFQTAA